MRFAVILIVALMVSVALIAFPDIADQILRIEAFGWVFETRQGAFLVALLTLLFVLWALRSLLAVLFAGPGVLWQSLRMGSRKRREHKLKEALAQCLDQRGDSGIKALKRSRGALPDWAMDMLRTLATPASRLPAPTAYKNQQSLNAVLAARIATDPHAQDKPPLHIRKAYLETWLEAHPDAPLAIHRLADLAEEEGNWLQCSELLEAELKRAHGGVNKPLQTRLVHAYLKLVQHEPDNAIVFLRKAYQLQPEDDVVLLAYGDSLIAANDSKTAQRLWSGHIERINSPTIATALLSLQIDQASEKGNAMRAYRKLEGKKDTAMTDAQRWLRAELAHAAKLDGLAFEHMQALADEGNSSIAWRSLGHWYQALAKYEQAAFCLSKACESR